MGTIKKLSLFCCISLLSTLCFARQLCFQIVQHDSAAKELTEQSLTIEDEVLNSFFDYGFIVTKYYQKKHGWIGIYQSNHI